MRIITFLIVIIAGFLLLSAAGSVAAQDDDAPEYFGIRDCGDCHRGVASDHLLTPHARALSDEIDEGIIADFSVGEEVRTILFPGDDEPRPFTAEDVAYIMGSGRYMQAYVYQTEDGGYRVFPAEWIVSTGEWHALEGAENWLTDESFNWVTQCAGCHTTGLNLETVEWVDDGVSCEACHGPGSIHVEMADELPRSPEPEELDALLATIVVSPDSQICGQCHTQGIAADGVHRFPTDYVPGETLVSEDSYALVAPDDEAHWWASGHASSTNMQYNEWVQSAHASSLETLQGSEFADTSCLGCHSGDYRFIESRLERWEELEYEATAPEPITLATAQQGIGCVTCHNPHAFNDETEMPVDFFLRDEPMALCLSCHTDPDLNDGVHHPVQQMFEGAPVAEAVAPMPSAHFAAENGPNCVTCHMAQIPMGGFTLASHTWEIVPPELNIEGAEQTCASCHAEQVDAAGMQALINDTQTSIQTRVDAIHAALESNSDAPEWVEVAVAFVDGDSSRGIHNIPYTDQLLAAVETEIGLTSIESTPEAAVTTAVTPVENATVADAAETESTSETGLAPQAIAIMVVAVLIMLAGIFAFFRGGNQS